MDNLERINRGQSGGLFEHELIVQVGMSGPALNVRKAKDVVQSYGGSISHAYARKIRAAIVDMTKEGVRNKAQSQVALAALALNPPPVSMGHIHDEAPMKHRSYNAFQK